MTLSGTEITVRAHILFLISLSSFRMRLVSFSDDCVAEVELPPFSLCGALALKSSINEVESFRLRPCYKYSRSVTQTQIVQIP